nr:PREDICTED: uncharacterized protein C2orf71 homolog isoform X2 [Latimeria chalumnae]|eukprot:XP_014343316.1 PREDICTED: uncharacterized protein C2orf71 homolog isoform X2 [Latimeria chalumnae]
MGCAPSHSDIIQTIAKNTSRPLKKIKSLKPPEQRNEDHSNTPVSEEGSSVWDTDGDSHQGEVWKRHKEREPNSYKTEESFAKDLPSLSGSASMPRLNKEERKTEGSVMGADATGSNLVKKHIAQDTRVQKQDQKAETDQKQMPKKSKKAKKGAKHGRQARLIEESLFGYANEQKVDFPELLVKAHQNAYAYLNPSLSKYEAILSMADQATQSQLILQQMLSFLAFRFEEVNCLLAEIAYEGERILKEVGQDLAWPAGKGDPRQQPDLLQQLLQYTVNKMQLVNGTVAFVTTNTLQETCSYLQSAADILQEKLTAKQQLDERLHVMVNQFEASAVRCCHSHPNDMPLFSEDSGIGGDNESIKECCSLGKFGKQASCDSTLHGACGEQHPNYPQAETSTSHSASFLAKSHDCALENHFKGIFYPSEHDKGGPSCSTAAPTGCSNKPSIPSCLQTSHSLNSFDSSSTLEKENFKDFESMDSPSFDEDDDDTVSLSEIASNVLLRPTSPTEGETCRTASKRIENPENEEMILKMKDAISDKIQFVPIKSGSNEWSEDEEQRSKSVRPSTANICKKNVSKHRRSRSAESLRSQGEDPTLLELQRTQKDLSKRLENMGKAKTSRKESQRKQEAPKPKITANSQETDQLTSSFSTNKLKASLDKNFNILPSQDKIKLKRSELDSTRLLEEKRGRKPLKVIAIPSASESCNKENGTAGLQREIPGRPTHRQSVRKLIDTFSQGDGAVKIAPMKALAPLKGVKKLGVPIFPSVTPTSKEVAHLKEETGSSSTERLNHAKTVPSYFRHATVFPSVATSGRLKGNELEIKESGEDLENLPPPPLEILMDNSFQSFESTRIESRDFISPEVIGDQASIMEHVVPKKMAVFQKMKDSLSNMHLLPSKNIDMTAARLQKMTGQERDRSNSLESQSTSSENGQESALEINRSQEMDDAANLYKQFHKIIHLQNTKDHTSSKASAKDPLLDQALPPSQKQKSLDSVETTEESPALNKRIFPSKCTIPSPPPGRRLPSPPLHKRHVIQSPSQPSPPSTRRQASPPANPRLQSPPAQRKLPSPPAQRKLSSPPMLHRQPSPTTQRKLPSPPTQRKLPSPPTQRKLPSPPTAHKEVSPSSFCTISPPVSPSLPRKGLLQNSVDSGDEQHPSSRSLGNAQSIFCPATPSLFEAKPPLLPNHSSVSSPAPNDQVPASRPPWRNNFMLRQWGDQQRRISLTVTSPQPFVRRSYSDRRPGVHLRLPVPISVSAGSEPVLNNTSISSVLPPLLVKQKCVMMSSVQLYCIPVALILVHNRHS